MVFISIFVQRGNLADSIDSSDLLDDVLTVPAATVTPMKPEQDDVEEVVTLVVNTLTYVLYHVIHS